MSGWQSRLVFAVVVALLVAVVVVGRSRHADVPEPADRERPTQKAAAARSSSQPAWRDSAADGDRGPLAAAPPQSGERAAGGAAVRGEAGRAQALPGAPDGLAGRPLSGRARGVGDGAAADDRDAIPAAAGNGLSEAATASGVAPVFAAFDQKEGGGASNASPTEQQNVDFSSAPGAYFPPDAVLGYPGRGGLQVEQGTVMFWVQPVDWDGSDNLAYSFFLLRDTSSLDHHFAVLKAQQSLRYQIVNADGVEFDVFAPINDWQRGEWHHVAATWGDSLMDLWIDGVLVGERDIDGIPSVQPNSPAYWGSSRGTSGAGAILADGRIFDSVLTADDIQAEAQRVPH